LFILFFLDRRGILKWICPPCVAAACLFSGCEADDLMLLKAQ
jgi:hypothetical protein